MPARSGGCVALADRVVMQIGIVGNLGHKIVGLFTYGCVYFQICSLSIRRVADKC